MGMRECPLNEKVPDRVIVELVEAEMNREPSSDPEKPPNLPNRTPLWIALALAVPALTGPSRGVWIAAVLSIAAFCGLARVVPRRILERFLNVVGTVAVCGVFIVLGYCVGFNKGSAVFGKVENGVHYVGTDSRFGGGREIAVGKPLYWRMFFIEAITIVSFGVLIAGSAVFYPEDLDRKKQVGE
jgi:hypothetical protein